ncbi:relA-associated inhibitor isoform X2 [Heptranchias perlo]
MTEEQRLGSVCPPVLECYTGHLADSEQMKLNEATFKLDRLSQELQSMWSTQGSPATADIPQHEAKTYLKDCPVASPTTSNTYDSSKSESQSKYNKLLPAITVAQSPSPQPSQTYTPLFPTYPSDRASSPYSFDLITPPLLYSPQEQHIKSEQSPPPRRINSAPLLCSPQEQHGQLERAPSPRAGFSRVPQHEHLSSPSNTMDHQIGLFRQSPSPYSGPCYPPDRFSAVSPRENIQPLGSTAISVPERDRRSPELEGSSQGGRLKTNITLEPGAFSVNTGDSLKKKAPRVWAEADLDIAYEKKASQTQSYENKRELNWNTAKQGGSWRQTDLDLAVSPNKAAGGRSKAYDSIQIYGTLPKGTNLPAWRHSATPPKQKWPFILGSAQTPWGWANLPSPGQARIGGPPRTSPIKERRNVLPLSVLIRPTMVNSRARLLPGHSAVPTARTYPQLRQPPDVGRWAPESSPVLPDAMFVPVPPGEVEPEIVNILRPVNSADVESPESVPRPLSPTRLQPVSLPGTETVQDMEELLRIRAAIPRALKRRTSIDQPATQLIPMQRHTRMYQQLTKLFSVGTPKKQQEQAEGQPSDPDLGPLPLPPCVESPTSPPTSALKRSILKRDDSVRICRKTRARLDPLVVLLDAALLGELDVVERVVYEMNDPSQSNDEGITGLHNAVCGGHYNVVEFLVNFGVKVNAPDSHGWTPLHCAASCNDLQICTFLVRKGAAIFSMTLSDGATAAEKCDSYLDGYEECARFLFSAEQQAGMMNNAVVYALWDYEAENSDELTFREGETITILRRGDKEESSWWWASLYGREGYVPYNFLGLFPRVRPQRQV